MSVWVRQGMWVKGLRQGHGEMTWSRSGQSFKGEFYAGLRHGFGVWVSPITGITFEGEFRKGQVHGAGTLIVTDRKTKKQRRVRRGLWHKSDFAPAGFLKMKDLVHIIDKVGWEWWMGGFCMQSTSQSAEDSLHSSLLSLFFASVCLLLSLCRRIPRRHVREQPTTSRFTAPSWLRASTSGTES